MSENVESENVESENVEQIVVVGGGLAAAKAVEALRAEGFDGRLTVIAGEQELPYERPPLSKGYLQGATEFEDAVVHSAEWYREHDVDLRLGVWATGLDTDAHELSLSDDTTLSYAKLLLATGASPRLLGMPGAVAENIFYLRTRRDADILREQFGTGRHLVIIGAGWIGLEVAAAARQADTEVTLVEMAELPLLGTLGHEMGKMFHDLHREHDVDLRMGLEVDEIVSQDGRVAAVQLSDGSTVQATAVLGGIGVLPNLDLAMDGGLAVGNGVLVDASLQTSDPDVYAVGDIALHDHPLFGRIRVEHWATALKQPAAAAAAMLGDVVTYDELPYFFSDQYDLGMEYIGHAPQGSFAQVVVRGSVERRKFVAFWLDDEHRIMAAMNVNVWDVIEEIKPLIRERVVVNTDQLADDSVPYSGVRAEKS